MALDILLEVSVLSDKAEILNSDGQLHLKLSVNIHIQLNGRWLTE